MWHWAVLHISKFKYSPTWHNVILQRCVVWMSICNDVDVTFFCHFWSLSWLQYKLDIACIWTSHNIWGTCVRADKISANCIFPTFCCTCNVCEIKDKILAKIDVEKYICYFDLKKLQHMHYEQIKRDNYTNYISMTYEKQWRFLTYLIA